MTGGGETGFTVLVGHPRRGSRTGAVASRAAALLRQALAAQGLPVAAPCLTELTELGPALLGERANGSSPEELALTALRQAPLVLMASPTFRGSYSGLLKLFLDLLPRHGLSGTVTVPLMTAGIPAHRSAVDGMLRPVLLEMRATLPERGISVLETEFARLDEVFGGWWAAQGAALVDMLSGQGAHQPQVSTC